jgi:hypothetical protein
MTNLLRNTEAKTCRRLPSQIEDKVEIGSDFLMG